jgi:ubiquitin related modifier 1
MYPTNRHSGGLEMLFSDQRKHKVALPAQDEAGRPANIAFLIRYLCENVMTDQKKELFLLDECVYVLL